MDAMTIYYPSLEGHQKSDLPQNQPPVQANGRSIGKLALGAVLLTAAAAAGYALYSGACAYDGEEGMRCGETTLNALTNQLSEKLNVTAEAVKVATQSTLNCINGNYTFQSISNCVWNAFSNAPTFTPPLDVCTGDCLTTSMLYHQTLPNGGGM